MSSPVRTRAVLLVVSLALMTVVSAVSGLNTALPEIAVATGADQTELTWILDSYTVVFAGLLLLAGAVGDRYGRRLLLAAGLVVFAVTSAAGLLVDTPTALIVIRALSGIGAAAIMPSTLSVITTSFPPAERGKAVGVWVGVAGGGAVLGLLATALLLEFFDWSSFFALNLVLALVALGGVLRWVPESREPAQRLDWAGGLLSLVGVGALVLGIIEGAARGWDDPVSVGGFVVGGVALVAFVLRELRTDQPLLDPRVFRDRGLTAGSLSITVQFFAQFGFIYVGIQYLQYVAGFSPLEAALRLLPMAVVVIPASRLAGSLSRRHSQKLLGTIGLVLLASGLFLLARQDAEFDVWRFWGALCVYGLGMAFAATPATTAITSAMPDDKQGVASAVNDVSREVGSAIGIAVLGAALTTVYRDEVAAATGALPAQLSRAVESGLAFTRMSPPPGTEAVWPRLVTAAEEAFVAGMSQALTVAAVVVAVTALVVAVMAPRHREVGSAGLPESEGRPAPATRERV
ncbi:MFS transporter [Phycicoccus sp. MAQZ13P-2]|uniref:MFS transporter n=1 Tax=Phycicoccus mangrovi TaxID=2840470 RepID=UPI001C0019ED|nr:MFS transporter [Phycicoccus mangrovi]MBT9255639.1 MFS transporter [Phycicoccus mangrovi]MBT9275353.1 MFS transporter [Phycicoccus mangrovi]